MIEINLLPDELKVKVKTKKTGINVEAKKFLYIIPLVLGLLLCVHIYLALFNISRAGALRALESKWKTFESKRKELQEFNKEYSVSVEDEKAIKQLLEQRINWAEKLNKLSLNLPSGVWFNELTVTRKDLIIKGSVVSLQKQEMNLIKGFIDNLKTDKAFFKDFNTLELTTADRKTISGLDVVEFVLQASYKAK